MPSSTSASDRAFVRSALAAFAGTLVLLLVPYESLVRAAERRWGVRPARIAPRQSGTPNVDIFLEDLAMGINYRAVAIGTSRVENAIRPDVLEPVVGRTYNLAIVASSSIATLDFLDSIHARPERLIVGVSPMDLTPLGVRRGQKAIARRAGVTASSTHWFYALLHSAHPDRRRGLGKWLQFRHDRGELLAFLNNENATGKPDAHQWYGYAPVSRVIDPEMFANGGEWGNIPGEYAGGREELSARLIDLVRRFRARGTDVVLVRIPTTAATRRSEDADTTFAADIVRIASESGAPYVDGQTLLGASFLATRANFADSEHLNDGGAEQFSRALARWLSGAPSRTSAAAPSPGTPRLVRASSLPPPPASLPR